VASNELKVHKRFKLTLNAFSKTRNMQTMLYDLTTTVQRAKHCNARLLSTASSTVLCSSQARPRILVVCSSYVKPIVYLYCVVHRSELGLPLFHFPNPGRGSGVEPLADGRPGVSHPKNFWNSVYDLVHFDAIWWQLFVGR